jgi:hypothetical protein
MVKNHFGGLKNISGCVAKTLRKKIKKCIDF